LRRVEHKQGRLAKAAGTPVLPPRWRQQERHPLEEKPMTMDRDDGRDDRRGPWDAPGETEGALFGGSMGRRVGNPGYADHDHASGGTQSSLGGSRRFDQHGGQSGNQWQSHGVGLGGSPMGGSYFGGHKGGFGSHGAGGMSGHSGGFDRGDERDFGRPSSGFDQQRYGQQGLGSWGGPDDHAYRNWRDQQMQAFDLEYEEFRRHRQERFAAEFDEWRRSRGGPGSAGQASGARPKPDESGGMK
jgi:hypothetical protein